MKISKIHFVLSNYNFTVVKFTVYDTTAAVVMTDLQILNYTVSIRIPKVIIGGFIGTLKDVRFFSGTLARERSGAISDCGLSLGVSYLQSFSHQAPVQLNPAFCVICSTKLLYPELGTCNSSCPTFYKIDLATNTCRYTQTGIASIWKTGCDPSCQACYAYDSQTCISCTSNYNFLDSSDSCVASCPANYIATSISSSGLSSGACVPLETVRLSASIVNATDSTYNVVFSEPIVTTNAEIQSNVIITMTNTDSTNGSCNSSLYNATVLTINCYYLQTMTERFLTVTFKDPSKIVTYYNKTLDSSSAVLQIYSGYAFVITSTENDSVMSIARTIEILLGCSAIFILMFIYTNNAWIVWSIIDCFQLLNYIQHINTQLPYNVQTVLEILGIFNLTFIKSVLDPNDFVNQTPPSSLTGYESTSFLYNASKYIIIYLVMGIAYLISFILTLIRWRDERFKLKVMRAYLIVKIMILRVYLFTYLEVAMMFNLQMKYYDLSTDQNIASFATAIVFGVGTTLILLLIMWNVQKKFSENASEHESSALMDLLEEFDLSTFISRNFAFFLLIRKILTVPILLYLFNYQTYQMGLIINLTLNVSLWIVVQKIYKKTVYFLVNIVFEFGFLAVCVTTFVFIILDQIGEKNEGVKERIGWVVVYMIIVIIGIFMVFGSILALNLLGKLIKQLMGKQDRREITTSYTTTEGEGLREKDARNMLKYDIELSNIEANTSAEIFQSFAKNSSVKKSEKSDRGGKAKKK